MNLLETINEYFRLYVEHGLAEAEAFLENVDVAQPLRKEVRACLQNPVGERLVALRVEYE